jgi:hypothetical protein
MKLTRYLSLCLVVQFAMLLNAPAAEAESAYQQAVSAYVTAAGGELQAMRAQAEAAQDAAPEDKKENYKDFFAKLEKCEATHKTLKTAKDFDKTKALYEQQRLEAVKAWAKVSSK